MWIPSKVLLKSALMLVTDAIAVILNKRRPEGALFHNSLISGNLTCLPSAFRSSCSIRPRFASPSGSTYPTRRHPHLWLSWKKSKSSRKPRDGSVTNVTCTAITWIFSPKGQRSEGHYSFVKKNRSSDPIQSHPGWFPAACCAVVHLKWDAADFQICPKRHFLSSWYNNKINESGQEQWLSLFLNEFKWLRVMP